MPLKTDARPAIMSTHTALEITEQLLAASAFGLGWFDRRAHRNGQMMAHHIKMPMRTRIAGGL